MFESRLNFRFSKQKHAIYKVDCNCVQSMVYISVDISLLSTGLLGCVGIRGRIQCEQRNKEKKKMVKNLYKLFNKMTKEGIEIYYGACV